MIERMLLGIIADLLQLHALTNICVCLPIFPSIPLPMRDLDLKQFNREIQFHSPLGPDVLLPVKMTTQEALGDLFCYQIELFSTSKKIKPADLLGKPVALTLDLPQQQKRYWHGLVTRFFRSGGFDSVTHYQAEVRPWLWLLGKSSDCRIFQNKTVLEILREICTKPVYGGLCNFDLSQLGKHYPKLHYCVQYRETDLHFVSRLLEQFGIYYFFRHSAEGHCMQLVDAITCHQAQPNYSSIAFATDASRDRYGDETISMWRESGEVQTGAFELNDFDFERFQVSINGGLRVKEKLVAHDQIPFEAYDYPGYYQQQDEGKQFAKAGIEAMHGQSEVILGATNARGLLPGALFDLREHPIADQNQSYLLTTQSCELKAEDYVSGNGETGLTFRCEFTAVGRQYPYRPPRRFKKPVVYGPQTAMVVGKAGEEIWTDKYGRVKVQFHWDRQGQTNEQSSCWVRVAQSWAGKRWGTMFIPRIGMEVVVEFLEGDPDQPLITGCVYNSHTMPPYDLPAHQTRSSLKTQSSKNATGFNEMRFEDKAGQEQLFFHAQRDMDSVVKHNDSQSVGNDRSINVQGNHIEHIVKNMRLEVDGNQYCSVRKDRKIEILEGCLTEITQGDRTITVNDGNQKNTVQCDIEIESKAGEIVVTSPKKISFVVGDSRIDITATNITIKSTMIDFNP